MFLSQSYNSLICVVSVVPVPETTVRSPTSPAFVIPGELRLSVNDVGVAD